MNCPKCGSDDVGEIITFHCFNCASKFSAMEMLKANRGHSEKVKDGEK